MHPLTLIPQPIPLSSSRLARLLVLFVVASCRDRFGLYLNCFQIAPEEQGLRLRFGPEYSLYAARVRRWL